MTTVPMRTFLGDEGGRWGSVVPDPFRDPFDAPFALLTRPPVGHCSGASGLNWDGTPAHSSGARGRPAGQPPAYLWRQSGDVA